MITIISLRAYNEKDLKGKERVVPPGIEIPGIPARKLVKMRVRNIDQDPDSLHQRIIADDDLGFTQAIIAQRQGCAQSTVSQVLAAERLRRLRAELGKDADGPDGPETSVRAVHAAEQVREALAYVRAVEKRLKPSSGFSWPTPPPTTTERIGPERTGDAPPPVENNSEN